MVVAYETDGMRHHYVEFQFFQPVVHKCGKHGYVHPRLVVIYRPERHVRQFLQTGAHRHLVVCPVVFAEYPDVFHNFMAFIVCL